LGKSYQGTIYLLSEMSGITEEIGLTRLPHFIFASGLAGSHDGLACVSRSNSLETHRSLHYRCTRLRPWSTEQTLRQPFN